MDHHFEVFEDKAGKYRFRFRANNGQIIASSSHAYQVKTAAKEDIEQIKHGRIQPELYKDAAGEHRWRMKHGQSIVATGSEGYKAKSSCTKGLASVLKRAPAAKIEVLDA